MRAIVKIYRARSKKEINLQIWMFFLTSPYMDVGRPDLWHALLPTTHAGEKLHLLSSCHDWVSATPPAYRITSEGAT